MGGIPKSSILDGIFHNVEDWNTMKHQLGISINGNPQK